MDNNLWIDRLYSDAGLTSNLHDADAEQLLRWAESQLENLDSEQEAERLLASLRLVNRYVREGQAFEGLFAALRAHSLRSDRGSTQPDDLGLEINNVYPTA
jgi:hypothetical protein